MKSWVLFGVALALVGPGRAGADEPPPTVVQAARPLAQTMLRAESSFWWGYTLRRGDEYVGPGLLCTRLSDAVRGSPRAETHATHARTFAGFAMGFGITAVGLFSSSVGLYAAQGGRWDSSSSILAATGALFVVAEFMTALGREQEVLKSVSAYNYDLAQRQP